MFNLTPKHLGIKYKNYQLVAKGFLTRSHTLHIRKHCLATPKQIPVKINIKISISGKGTFKLIFFLSCAYEQSPLRNSRTFNSKSTSASSIKDCYVSHVSHGPYNLYLCNYSLYIHNDSL